MTMLPLTPENAGAVITTAAGVLVAGGVAVIPTDTVYGLAAHPGIPNAVARLAAIKQRPDDTKPIALLAADVEAVRRFGATLSPSAERLAAAFWPGPLTLVLDCGGKLEGFRVPAHVWARRLLAACGGTLRVTSANLSGGEPAASAVAALQDVGLHADLVVDDGPSPDGVPSTVVRLSGPVMEVLRTGAIAPQRLADVAMPGA